MRRNVLYIAVACMTLLASCKKEIKQVLPEAVEVEFGATVDESNGSKTYLDGTSVLWADGDQISVNGTAIDLVAGAGYRYGTFCGKVTPYSTDKFYVGYPASATTFNEGAMSVAIPAAQTYNSTQTLLGYMPMAAYIEGTGNKMTLHFHNAANLLKFQLFGTAGDASKVTKIEITSTAAALTGKIAVTANGTDNVTFGAMTEPGNTIILDCGEGVQLTNEPTAFYVIIPKIASSATLNVKIYCANGAYQENTLTSTFNSVNMIYSTAVKEVSASNIGLPGEFSVADGKKVQFSQGNLQYLGSGIDGNSSPIWRFAEHQWDYMGGGPSNSTANLRGNVDISGYTATGTGNKGYNNEQENTTAARDLFAWGCTGSPDLSYPGTSSSYYYNPYDFNSDANGSYFGPANGHDLTVSNNSDWGWLRIKNGGDAEYSGWFTLSKAQYDYLLGFSTSKRTNAENLRAFKTLDGTKGLVILPDGSDVSVMSSITTKADLSTCNAVFLPAAGYIYILSSATTIGDMNDYCDYWSCSYVNNEKAYYLYFGSSNGTADRPRNRGYAVRLVRDASNSGGAIEPFELENW